MHPTGCWGGCGVHLRAVPLQGTGILKAAAAALQAGLCQALLCAGSGAGRSCQLFVVSVLSLTAVLCPSAHEELSEGLVWGRSKMGYCLCLCGLERSRSQFHIICFLAET